MFSSDVGHQWDTDISELLYHIRVIWIFLVLGGGSYPGMIQFQAGQPFMHADIALANSNLSNAGTYKPVDGR